MLFPIVGMLVGGKYRWQGRDYARLQVDLKAIDIDADGILLMEVDGLRDGLEPVFERVVIAVGDVEREDVDAGGGERLQRAEVLLPLLRDRACHAADRAESPPEVEHRLAARDRLERPRDERRRRVGEREPERLRQQLAHVLQWGHQPVSDIVEAAKRTGYSRFPVIGESSDDIRGVVISAVTGAGSAGGGASSGAIAAFMVAWERPNEFRKVLSIVGSFVNLRGGHVYPERVLKSEKKPIHWTKIAIRNMRFPKRRGPNSAKIRRPTR